MFNRFDLGNDGTLGLFMDWGSSPSSPPPSSGNSMDWNGIIRQGFGLASHMVSAWSGQNSGTQIGYNPASGSVFSVAPQGGSQGGYSGYQQPAYTPEQLLAIQRGGGVGGTIGGGIDGVFNWLMQNPLITFGGIAAVYLLMREPPRRR